MVPSEGVCRSRHGRLYILLTGLEVITLMAFQYVCVCVCFFVRVCEVLGVCVWCKCVCMLCVQECVDACEGGSEL